MSLVDKHNTGCQSAPDMIHDTLVTHCVSEPVQGGIKTLRSTIRQSLCRQNDIVLRHL